MQFHVVRCWKIKLASCCLGGTIASTHEKHTRAVWGDYVFCLKVENNKHQGKKTHILNQKPSFPRPSGHGLALTHSLSSPLSRRRSPKVSSKSSNCWEGTRSRQLMCRSRTRALASYWPEKQRHHHMRKNTLLPLKARLQQIIKAFWEIIKHHTIMLASQITYHLSQKMTPGPVKDWRQSW